MKRITADELEDEGWEYIMTYGTFSDLYKLGSRRILRNRRTLEIERDYDLGSNVDDNQDVEKRLKE